MTRFTGRRFTSRSSTALSLLASFVVLVSLSGALDTALAADDPSAASRKSSQVNPLEIPGSFKDLPDAKDAMTMKRSTAPIESPVRADAASTELSIDSLKVPVPGFTYADSEMEDFHATAYCLKGRTASGINTRPGVIAADPRVLPIGTVVHLRSGSYTGTYTVLDTGGRIKGRRVDVYVPTHREAIQFGRRQVKIKVIGRGKGRAGKSLLASGS